MENMFSMIEENVQLEKDIRVKEKEQIKCPPKYGVVIHNDNYTTMEFVVHILMRIFHKNRDEAMRLMWEIHKKEKALVEIYTFDLARTKVVEVHQAAKSNEFPLKATAEPIE